MTTALDELPPPRANPHLIGHEAAESAAVQAIESGRLHHAWLIAGPPGIGKATFAYRFARRLLEPTAPPGFDFGVPAAPSGGHSLAMSADAPIFRRVAASGHADLMTVEREGTATIPVASVRRLHGFLHLTAGEAERRVVVVDSADELNVAGANALLKILEEPPDRAVMLLVSHAPRRLPPTVRSRCRLLRLSALSEDEVSRALATLAPDLEPETAAAAATIAGGSVGMAVELIRADGVRLRRDLDALLEHMPGVGPDALWAFADRFSGKESDAAWRLFVRFFGETLTAAALGAAGQGSAPRWAAGVALERWIAVWEKTGRLFDRAVAVNLDRPQVAVSCLLALQAAVR